MSSNLIKKPFEIILDPNGGGGRAKPVANGKFYAGEIDKDPVANPRTDIAYKDESGQERPLTSPLTLNNSGAFVVSENDGTIIQPYMKDAVGFSVLITDSRGRDVYSNLNTGDPGNIVDAISEYTNIVYRASGGKSSFENMIAGFPVKASDGDILQTDGITWRANTSEGLPISGGLFARVLTSNENDLNSDKKFNETFGGYIIESSTLVEKGKIYLNLILTDDKYGSYLYFDAPDTPVSPVAYSSSYGGTVKNGIFGSTDRDAVNMNTKIGYRAGWDSTSTLAVYNGVQAGEGSTDKKVDSLTGGSVATGVTASYKSTSKSSCTYGLESGSRQTGDWSNFYGSYTGSVNTGVGSDGFGFKALLHNTGIYCSGFGYGTLQENTGNYNYGFGAFVLSSSTGEKNTAGGARSLSNCSGDNNATWGYRACFVTGGRTGSNGSYFGSEAGEDDNSNGSSGFGRSALKGNSGDFASGFGYLAGVDNTYARSTMIGQQSQVTGVDQIQLGAPGSSVYAYGPVQDRSDERDKTDFKPISDKLKNFLLDVEFQTYRFDYRDSYVDYVHAEDGLDSEGNPTYSVVKIEAVKDGSRSGSRHHAGVVAQQVKDAMDKHGVDFAGYQDHKVNGGADVLSIGYQQFIPIIGALVQDQEKTIKNLLSEIEKLEERISKAGL